MSARGVVLLQPDRLAESGSGKAVEPEQGFVWLEWIGQPSPSYSPTVRMLMVGKKLSPQKKKVLRDIMERAIVRVDGRTRRIMRRGNGYGQIPHLSQDWIWGPKANAKPGQPGSYIQKVPYRDADLLKSSAAGKEWRVLGYAGDTDVEPITAVTNAVLFQDVFSSPEAVRLGEGESVSTYQGLKRSMGW